ncbi:MAG: UDP-N-acetylmuramate dehydrogenase [Acidobacteria bacterium]|nr:UDP-N-acetylmuramate dehydrogenase [Acidobacteriota bacterium]
MRIENPQLLAALPELGVEHCRDEQLAGWTSLAVGGTTDVLVIHQLQHLPDLVALLGREGAPWRFVGGGTNLLVGDGELPWLALHLASKNARLEFAGNQVRVPAAADLGRTVMECAKRNLGGMEGLIGVPGSVGGALRMNAGAYGIEIGQFVRRLDLFRAATRTIETVPASEAGFRYRHTAFAPSDVMVAVELELPAKPYEEILATIKMCNEKRRASQPLNEKSAGCIFKNPPGASAGKMIDELALKGHRVGGAIVSERHANFFVNRFQATADDLLRLIDYVKERIRQAFGYELEEEVIIWKN